MFLNLFFFLIYINFLSTNKLLNLRKKLQVGALQKQLFYSALFFIKGPLSGLRQFLATESPVKMTENAF